MVEGIVDCFAPASRSVLSHKGGREHVREGTSETGGGSGEAVR